MINIKKTKEVGECQIKKQNKEKWIEKQKMHPLKDIKENKKN